VLERVVGDKAVEVMSQGMRHCGRAPRPGTVGAALDPLGSKAMDPLTERRRGTVQRV